MRIGDITWVGSILNDGRVAVDVIDHARGKTAQHIINTIEADDHNNPSVLAVAGKPPIAFYNRHGADSVVRYRVAQTNADVMPVGFGALQTIAFPVTVSYVIAEHVAGDEIWLWARGTLGAWYMTRSADWGGTWSTPIDVFTIASGDYLYQAHRIVGAVDRVAMAQHPIDAVEHDIYYAEIDTTTGDITVPGSATSLGNVLTDTSLPITYTGTQRVRDVPTGIRSWVYDVGSGADPEVLWVEFDSADIAGTSTYWYAKRTGGAWVTNEIVGAGDKWGMADTAAYLGSAHFTGPGEVVLARENAGTWTVERHTTTDDGATWTAEVIATDSTNIICRPFPIDGTDLVAYQLLTSFGNGDPYASDAYLYWQGRLVVGE